VRTDTQRCVNSFDWLSVVADFVHGQQRFARIEGSRVFSTISKDTRCFSLPLTEAVSARS
jgi:hypothetical protein